MHHLAVSSRFSQRHQDAFDGGKGSIGLQVVLDRNLVHLQPGQNPLGSGQQLVADQERLRQKRSAVG
jgi:hypothetical protein